jgi:hypothetical protein
MFRKILCLLGFHEWELKETLVFMDTDTMDVCKYCGKYKEQIVVKTC